MKVFGFAIALSLSCAASEEEPKPSEYDALFVDPSISTADATTLPGTWARVGETSPTQTVCVHERMQFSSTQITYAKRCTPCAAGDATNAKTVGVRLAAKFADATIEITESGEQRAVFDGVACDAVLRAGILRYELRDKKLVIEDVGTWTKVTN